MNKNKKNTKQPLSFKTLVANKGFYIALLTLIMVVGTVAVVRRFTAGITTNSTVFDDEAWESAIAQANEDEDLLPDADEEAPIDKAPSDTAEEFPPMVSGETVTASKELSLDEIIKELDMASPCTGKISREHSPDKLIYSKTTDDWRTHSGIDISAKNGEVVEAAADGVVEEVYEDEKLGITVVIGHSGNIKTLYSNLQDLSFIEVGRRVAKGDTIGAVGDSAIIEKKDKSHLHFEVIYNNESQDPSEYIPL